MESALPFAMALSFKEGRYLGEGYVLCEKAEIWERIYGLIIQNRKAPLGLAKLSVLLFLSKRCFCPKKFVQQKHRNLLDEILCQPARDRRRVGVRDQTSSVGGPKLLK